MFGYYFQIIRRVHTYTLCILTPMSIPPVHTYQILLTLPQLSLSSVLLHMCLWFKSYHQNTYLEVISLLIKQVINEKHLSSTAPVGVSRANQGWTIQPIDHLTVFWSKIKGSEIQCQLHACLDTLLCIMFYSEFNQKVVKVAILLL